MDPIYTPIRCPEERKHGVYNNCGRLLCAIKDGRIFLFCEMCKEFLELIIKDNNNVVLKRLPKNEKLKFKNKLKQLVK